MVGQVFDVSVEFGPGETVSDEVEVVVVGTAAVDDDDAVAEALREPVVDAAVP
jgi:hypothetical protein